MGSHKTKLHKFKKGLHLPISGTPSQVTEPGQIVTQVALLGDDYIGMRPRMMVNEGDKVVRGQPLIEDRKTPGLVFTSPAQGSVAAINRGERRVFRSIVINVDENAAAEEISYQAHTGKKPSSLTGEEVRALMIESGLWTALRSRPFGKIPAPDSRPHALFITAMDTHPLAPSPEIVLENEADMFVAGIETLVNLAEDRPVYLCTAEDSHLADILVAGVEVHRFQGPHPVGNPGFHIHVVNPAERDRIVWHIGYQDTVALGHLVSTGKLKVERTIALGGPAVKNPRLVTTRLGASLDELLRDEKKDVETRTISGSVLGGHDATTLELSYLGRYHNQVTVLEENRKREFLGWMAPGLDSFTVTKIFLSSLTSNTLFDLDTSTHGGVRAMVPSGAYDAVMPFDLMPNFLLKSLLSGDIERAEALGCLELVEEDVAPCTFVCSSKIDYGAVLRKALIQIDKEG